MKDKKEKNTKIFFYTNDRQRLELLERLFGFTLEEAGVKKFAEEIRWRNYRRGRN